MLGPRIGAHIGAHIGVRVGDPRSLAVTQDATSGKVVPQSATEWAAVLAAAGDASGGPSILLKMQEASGSLVDTIGGITFAASGTGLNYRQTVSGWSTKAITTADAATGFFSSSSASLPDISTTSCLVLSYVLFNSAPGTFRNVHTLGTAGTQARLFVKNGPEMSFFHGSNGGGGAVDPTGAVRPVWTQSDKTAPLGRFANDQQKIDAAFDVAVTGKYLAIVGEANGAADSSWLYTAVFFGAAAEKSAATIKAINVALGWTNGW